MRKKLYRSRSDKQVSGLLGGVAEYFDVDATLVRLTYVFLLIITAGIPLLLFYIVASVIVPVEPKAHSQKAEHVHHEAATKKDDSDE